MGHFRRMPAADCPSGDEATGVWPCHMKPWEFALATLEFFGKSENPFRLDSGRLTCQFWRLKLESSLQVDLNDAHNVFWRKLVGRFVDGWVFSS